MQPSLSGHTKPFAVLGHPIGHTLSPVMHNAALRELQWDAVYQAFDVVPEKLIEVLRAMQAMGFGGVNLTIPHKEVAFAGVDRLADSAQLLGGVNTIVFAEDGVLEGHNTDGYGILKALEESFGLSPAGREVLVLGCGGAGQAAARVAADAGATRIQLANRSPDRLQRVAAGLRADFPQVEIACCSSWPPPASEVATAELVLQSTSVGMKPEDDAILSAEAFHSGHCVLDLIYVEPLTGILREAEAAGAKVANGLGMLLHQGVRSFEIWTGTTPPVERMREALQRQVYGESD